ncbi:MAG: hypothetical protein JXA14_04345 [Anaerolineae bacterium]|nr:hypothetical protein [Anaerolineae bacterium]
MDARKGHIARRATLALQILLLVAPLAIGLAWRIVTDDSAYVTFRCAHNLASVRGLTYDPPLSDPPKSPLYVLVLWLPATLGLPLPQTGLILSILGWEVLALAIYSLCQATHRPVAAIVSAALVALSPVFVSALGTEISWVVALAWVAMALSASERWRLQTGALVLMLCLRFEISTLATAALLLGIRWIKRRRFPLKPTSAIAIVAIVWMGSAMLGLASPLSPPYLSPTRWLGTIERLLGESDLYWLFPPAIALGLFSLRKSPRILWTGLLWVALIALSGDAIAGALIATLGSLLAGLGIDMLALTILATIKPRNIHTPLHRLALAAGVVLILMSPLAMAQASSLLHHYRFRPTIRQAVERQAGDWLHAHSEPTASVLSSARVGFLASRATLRWAGETSDAAAFAALVETLAKSPPDYCVSYRDLHWDRMTHTGWFQDDYTSVLTFSSSHDTTSSLTIWRYAYAEKPQPVEATFGDRIRLVSFAAPDSLASGQTLEVRLYWKALQPLEEDYIVFVHLLDASGELVASHDGPPRDRESPTSTWLPGDVVPDVHRVALEPDTPGGTYQLWVGIYTWPDIERLPIRDREGVEQINRTLFLRTVEVNSKDE